MTLDTVTLSRLQFAFTIAYHIMWPAYSIGIAGFIVLLNGLWLRTGKTVYRENEAAEAMTDEANPFL